MSFVFVSYASPDAPKIRPVSNFELVIDAKAAKALGLVVPSAMLALADEVIE
jgi:hypothetical protein